MNQFIPSIDQLPQPPVWQQLLLERPWGAVGVLVIAAFLAVVVMNRREQFRRGLMIGGAILGVAGAIFATATLVETDHEKVRGATVRLIDAAATGDVAGTEALLASDSKLHLEGMGSFSLSREELLAGVEALDQQVGVSDHGILDRTAVIDGPNVARSRVVVRVGLQGGGPTFSSWELTWRLEADGAWRLARMECQSINGRSPGQWFAGELSRFTRQ